MLVFTDSVPAQQFLGAKAGILQHIQGEVFLDGNLLRLPRGSYIQLENGQRLSTEQGYLELVLNSGAYLRLGKDGLLRMEQNRLDDIQFVLERGSALIEVVDKTKGRIRMNLSTAFVEIKKAGLYRLDADPAELRVYGGAAVVANGNRKATIKSERMVRLNGDPASKKFDPNSVDALHEWAGQRSFDLFLANLGNRWTGALEARIPGMVAQFQLPHEFLLGSVSHVVDDRPAESRAGSGAAAGSVGNAAGAAKAGCAVGTDEAGYRRGRSQGKGDPP